LQRGTMVQVIVQEKMGRDKVGEVGGGGEVIKK
jgi:hypothetical protein